MASINISEDDFLHIALAANAAKDRNDMDEAQALDKIARKINAALTATSVSPFMRVIGIPSRTVSWKDMPSTLEIPE